MEAHFTAERLEALSAKRPATIGRVEGVPFMMMTVLRVAMILSLPVSVSIFLFVSRLSIFFLTAPHTID